MNWVIAKRQSKKKITLNIIIIINKSETDIITNPVPKTIFLKKKKLHTN